MKIKLQTTAPIAKVKSQEEYDKWLASLKERNLAVVQSFYPASRMLLDLPVERWELKLVRVVPSERRVFAFDDRGFHPGYDKTGVIDLDGFEVFSPRLVPLSPILGLNEENPVVCATEPIWEPLCRERHVFLVNRWRRTDIFPDNYQAILGVKAQFPHSYSLECASGTLIHAFAPACTEIPKKLQPLHLYSENL